MPAPAIGIIHLGGPSVDLGRNVLDNLNKLRTQDATTAKLMSPLPRN
jgi:hypothetical protein